MKKTGRATKSSGNVFADIGLPNKEKLARADITVRLVDDTFVFVYSRSDEVARQIQNWYPAAAQSQVKLGNLKIPY